MRKLVLFLGPPGVGKGTQCSFMKSRLGFVHISTGSIIRNEIASHSSLGLRVKALVEAGGLVDDKTMFECLKASFNVLPEDSNLTVLLDGLPRTVSQAQTLDSLLADFPWFDKFCVVSLEANPEDLVGRFAGRYTCSHCSHVSSLNSSERESHVLSAMTCPSCKATGSMVRRKDDEPTSVRNRLAIYEKETSPLLHFYANKIDVLRVDGLLGPEIVYIKVASFLA